MKSDDCSALIMKPSMSNGKLFMNKMKTPSKMILKHRCLCRVNPGRRPALLEITQLVPMSVKLVGNDVILTAVLHSIVIEYKII